jgi:hypothetical protein
MKPNIKAIALIILLALPVSVSLTSCSTPDARQDNRQDNRDGRQDNRDGRQDGRQDNRDDRQDNRDERQDERRN